MDHAVGVRGADHVLAVLEVLQVHPVVPLVGQLGVGEDRDGPGGRPRVGNLQGPVLKGLACRDEAGHLRADPGVVRLEDGVAQAVPDGRRVLAQRLADRLPGGGPVIACRDGTRAVVIAQIQIAARLVDRDAVEPHAQHPSSSARTVERIAAGVLRDDPAVQARAEVIDPRPRRVRPRDDVLAGGIVEVAEAHRRGPLTGRARSVVVSATGRPPEKDARPGLRGVP